MAKNIVLLSDGTGNRGGVGHETNVWHLYRAIDHSDEQLRYYDDGVGSEDFTLFKAIGGAFGWGLARNVRELYTALVRNWAPDDRIFLFGFSRGAFTVRLLAGMLARCGLVDAHHAEIKSEADLRHVVRAGYSAYRQSYVAPGMAERFRQAYGRRENGGTIPIHFIGVWDTVGAIGVPFDELREAIDRVLRYSFRDQLLASQVHHGCHAVALDDNRKTFHPVMWDERLESDASRIEQVWFAGVHSNIGGGYAKQQMAMVTLDWMVGRARAYGLKIADEQVAAIREAADVHGRLYDSRRRFAAYYRYRPRDTEAIRHDYTHGPLKLHASVVERIRRATNAYSPANLTEHARIGDQALSVTDTWRQAMAHAVSMTWLRQVLYFMLLTITGVILVLPWFSPSTSAADNLCGTLVSVPLWLVDKLAPDAMHRWLQGLEAHPCVALGVAVLLGLFLWWRQRLKAWTTEVASAGWYSLYPEHRPPPEGVLEKAEASPLLRLSARLRRSTALRLLQKIGTGTVIRLIVLGLYLPLQLGRWIHQKYCVRRTPLAGADLALPLPEDTERSLSFLTRDYERRTGLQLESGHTYRIRVEAYAGWSDAAHPASPDGLDPSDAAIRLERRVRPFLRHRAHPLFALMARVRGGGGGVIRVGQETTLQPERGGELSLYVNDVVVRFPLIRDVFYANNQGVARITVRRLPLI